MEQDYLQLGALAVISIYAVREFFGYLKTRGGGEQSSPFHNDISRELGGINEAMKAIPLIRDEIKRLADHVAVQNGRIAKLENKHE